MNTTLETELETYRRELPGLLQKEQGRYVLIHDGTVVQVFDTYKDAVVAGYEKFGADPFLVKRVQQDEQVQYFSRDLTVNHFALGAITVQVKTMPEHVREGVRWGLAGGKSSVAAPLVV